MSTRIALTNLEAYNNGELRFVWLAVPFDEYDELKIALESIGNPEEYFISDYETDIVGYNIDEYEDIIALNEIVSAYDSLDKYEQETVCAYRIVEGCSFQAAIEKVQDGDIVFHKHQSLADVAADLVDEGCFGDIPENIRNYIDYEAIGNDLRYDGYYEISEGCLWGVLEIR